MTYNSLLALWILALSGTASTQTLVAEWTSPDVPPERTVQTAVALDGDLLAVQALDSSREEAVLLFSLTNGLLHEFQDGSADFGEALAFRAGRLFIGSPNDDALGAGSGAVFEFDVVTGDLIQTWTDAENGAFGRALAIEDDVLVVGAPFADNAVATFGVAHVYDLVTGQKIRTLQPSSNQIKGFGWSVAVGDGVVAVGAPFSDLTTIGAGACDVFDLATGTLLGTLQEPVPDVSADFGISVAIDAGRLAAGVPRSYPDIGSVVVFDVATLAVDYQLDAPPAPFASSREFGQTVALAGDRLLVGREGASATPVQGPVLVDAATGVPLTDFDAPGQSGAAWTVDRGVALDATRAVVTLPLHAAGSTWPGKVRVYDLADTGTPIFDYSGEDGPTGDEFGSVAADGAHAIVGARFDDDLGPDAGSAYLFDVASATVVAELDDPDGPPTSAFGRYVDIAGTRAIVGEPNDSNPAQNAGAAWIFDVPSGALLHKLTADDGLPNDRFGSAVALHGTRALVGAPRVGVDKGAAYVFDVATGAQLQRLQPVDLAHFDEFGLYVAAGADWLVVSAPGADGLFSDEGVVYVFDALTGAQVSKIVPDVLTNGAAGLPRPVAITGDVAVVGTPSGTSGPSTVHAYDVTTGIRILQLSMLEPQFGSDVAIQGAHGGWTLLVGAGGASSAHLYDGSNGQLLQSYPASDPSVPDVALADDRVFLGWPALETVEVYDGQELPLAYCTAKPSSSGCVNAIGVSDAQALPTSGAGDYSVTCAAVQGQKNGILFAGTDGPAALPFSGGTLCVTPPLKRGPIQSSLGSPLACDGGFAVVVNDGQIVPLGLDPGPGETAWYQWWYRDPQNGPGTLGTALSDGMRLSFE